MINAQEFFTHALHDDERVTDLLAYTEDADGNHLPNIFEYPCEEELGDNPGKPYIVVQNTGTTPGQSCKDEDSFDAMHDNTTIEVTCVTGSKEDAKTVAAAARAALRSAMNSLVCDDPRTEGYYLCDSQYSDRGVQFDVESGNYYVTLTYTIETMA